MKLVVVKHLSIIGIQAEYHSHTEHIELMKNVWCQFMRRILFL